MYAFFLQCVLLGVVLSMPFCITAQQYIDDTPPPGYYSTDYVFANMNLSEVPSGLLLDHATPFTSLSAFNGHPDSTTISSPLRCQLVHATLVSAIVNSNAQINLTGIGASSYSNDTIPYKIILYSYHQLKEDAVAQGLISIANNQLHDISGIANSPYEEKQLLAAAAWRNGPLKEGQSYTIVPELWSNLGIFDVLSYEVNTGQGFIPFNLGTPLTITPGADATMDIELKVNLRNGETLFSANHFQNGGAGSILFDICYDDRDDIMEVNARGNYWGTDNANPSNVGYSLHQKAYGCSGLSEVDLITDNQAAGEPVGCPTPPAEPEYPTEVFCSIFANGHIKVDEYYYTAYKAYLDAIQNDLSTFQARQAFSIPAGIPDSHRNSASQVCKHYIDIARVMLDIENSYAYGGGHVLSDESHDIENSRPGLNLTHQTKIKVFPNPVEDIVYLSGISKESGVSIYDDNGRIVKQINDVDKSLAIDVSALAKGLYMLKIMDTQTGEFELHKIIVQ